MELQPLISKTLTGSKYDYDYLEQNNGSESAPYEFEVFDWKSACAAIYQNQNLAIYTAIGYVITVFSIQRFMKNREAFELKGALAVWNGALGIFSIIGFARTAPDFFNLLLQPDGIFNSLCVLRTGSMESLYWGLLFTLSKYVELGDTVFIVLRKRNLQFLQWYHHMVTLCMVWITVPYLEPVSKLFVILNYGVHSLMYPYFSLQALGFKIPTKFAHFITTAQLTQMFIGLFANIYTSYYYYAGANCYRNPTNIKITYGIYASFVVLFGKLFYDLVVANKKGKKAKVQ